MDTDGDANLSYSEFADFITSSCHCPPVVRVEHRPCSPLRSSPLKRPAEPSSPVREVQVYRSPVRCSSPVRVTSPPRYPVSSYPVYCSPVRCSSVRCSPVRCSPVRCSPTMKPILHIHEEDQLVNGLRDVVTQERELEASKVNLTLKPDFNLHDAFHIFDVNQDG